MRVFVEPAGAGELPKVPVGCGGQGQIAMTRHELAPADAMQHCVILRQGANRWAFIWGFSFF